MTGSMIYILLKRADSTLQVRIGPGQSIRERESPKPIRESRWIELDSKNREKNRAENKWWQIQGENRYSPTNIRKSTLKVSVKLLVETATKTRWENSNEMRTARREIDRCKRGKFFRRKENEEEERGGRARNRTVPSRLEQRAREARGIEGGGGSTAEGVASAASEGRGWAVTSRKMQQGAAMQGDEANWAELGQWVFGSHLRFAQLTSAPAVAFQFSAFSRKFGAVLARHDPITHARSARSIGVDQVPSDLRSDPRTARITEPSVVVEKRDVCSQHGAQDKFHEASQT
ncbi:hypothetical protein K0M31_009336 [Melipona bicolor]|uniref:Uncharacterized protein n=1 Tax=Melipona bicolor TaxID=60889 RepID=A0AA40KK12_9HYME|nr:hypothetical protein K0M31_009336 [Melipona bicolor]